MRILIIDGQGGGMGARLVSALKEAALPGCQLIGAGTNVLAANAMLKAGADGAASGENAIAVNAARANVILGPVGIVMANSLLGEITPRMAEAVASSQAEKILIPAGHCVRIAGLLQKPMEGYITEAVELVKKYAGICGEKTGGK